MLATLSEVLVPDNGVASGLSQGPLWLRLYPGTFFSLASSDSGGQRQLTLSVFSLWTVSILIPSLSSQQHCEGGRGKN